MKLSFRVILSALLFFALSPFVFSQETQNIENAAENAQVAESETKFDWGEEDSQTNRNVESSSSIWIFLKMLGALAVVAFCAFAVFAFLKKSAGISSSNDPFLRQVSNLSLGAGKSVRVVSLVDKAYIVGVTDNSVNLLAEIDDKELVDSMNLYADKNDKSSRPRSFSDVLDMFMPSKNKNVFSSNAQSAAVSLQRQREKFDAERKGERL